MVLQTFWNEEEGFMTETTTADVKKGRSGYGSAPLTVSVYNFDPSLGCDDATFQPCSPRALSSLKAVGDRFRAFFPLSQNFTERQPPYFGFFTEDEFIGGHVSSSDFRRINPPPNLPHLLAPVLLFFQFCRATVRRAHDVGHDWSHRCHASFTQILEAV